MNDYREYWEIEIELLPAKNKYGKFINIIKKEDKPYFHIYFNNYIDEVKVVFLLDKWNIKRIKIVLDYKINTFKYLFKNCECIEDMSFMLFNCTSLKELNLSNFITENVTKMG